jgi:hypothetical protein
VAMALTFASERPISCIGGRRHRQKLS